MSATADLFADEAPPAEVFDPRELSLTEGEWTRVLGGMRFRCLVDAVKVDWAGSRAVRCIACANAHTNGSHKIPWAAHCVVHRVMVSDTFPKLCREFVRK